ncbi:MAG: hypothetical protein OEZ30_08775 [Candidatus Aminicenantes bacterium]|nr:hypothetical protein [Candidatus Aminicenantes bacterium]
MSIVKVFTLARILLPFLPKLDIGAQANFRWAEKWAEEGLRNKKLDKRQVYYSSCILIPQLPFFFGFLTWKNI